MPTCMRCKSSSTYNTVKRWCGYVCEPCHYTYVPPSWEPYTPPSRKRKREDDMENVKLGRDRLLDVRKPPANIAKITAQNARSSPLLRLPSEIRERILKLVFGCLHIRIYCEKDSRPTLHDEKSGNFRRMTQFGRLHCKVSGVRYDDPTGVESWKSGRYEKPRGTITDLPLVCRQIYQETTLYRYAIPVYCFTNYRAISRWLNMLRPVQKRAVQTISINWFRPKECHLKEFTGLKLVYEGREETEEKAKVWAERGVQVHWNSQEDLRHYLWEY